jgi:hypothetical protein
MTNITILILHQSVAVARLLLWSGPAAEWLYMQIYLFGDCTLGNHHYFPSFSLSPKLKAV